MNSNEPNKDEVMIRLVLNPKTDQPLYNYFTRIKKDLGLKSNTEVARYCIKKTYETSFDD